MYSLTIELYCFSVSLPGLQGGPQLAQEGQLSLPLHSAKERLELPSWILAAPPWDD